ncbi:Zinc finger, PMZ-type [Sesbania bispinosa]|nr:Zinc finger, PMZ-type [Sesbania bispinosa]
MDYTWDASIDEETLVKILEDLSCYESELNAKGVYASVVEEDGQVPFMVHDDLNNNDDHANGSDNSEHCIGINSEQDIRNLDLENFSPHDISKYDFASMDLAYLFYREYGKANGFSIRKGKILYSKKTREELQQEYFCSNNGLREDRGLKMEDRKREPRAETRCECQATFRAHVDKITGRWYATVFNDNHNHELLGPKFSGMLPGHRRMRQGDVVQMNNMMKVGIAPSHIFASFANQCGGYDKIGFRKADIYNQILQQRRRHTSDAMATLQFLQDLSSKQSPIELEDDFASIHGDPVLRSNFEGIESCTQTLSFFIYKVCKVGQRRTKEWHVSFYPDEYEFSCSCLWMESRGLPCHHIIVVLVHLDIEELLASLVLKRWSKGAKDHVNFHSDLGNRWDSHKIARSAALMELYRILCDLKSDTVDEFNEERERLLREIEECKARKAAQVGQGSASTQTDFDGVRDPVRVNTKGRGGISGLRPMRRTKCSKCKQPSHNRVTCPVVEVGGHMSQPAQEGNDDDTLKEDFIWSTQ